MKNFLKNLFSNILLFLFTFIFTVSIILFTVFFFLSPEKKESIMENTTILDNTYRNVRLVDKSKYDVIEQTEPMSILLIGVDNDKKRTGDWAGNTDTMILLTINPNTNKTTLTSIQRDLLLDNGLKINASYQTGGIGAVLNNIEGLLDIDIDKYVELNMDGLVDLVDALGGIEVTNKFDFPISISKLEPEYTDVIPPGTHTINGKQALVYSRMRYDDPNGDYGRQLRQQEVIKKVSDKLKSFTAITNYNKVLEAVSENMRTDIRLNVSTVKNLLGYKDALNNIEQFQIIGHSTQLNGVSYELPYSDDLLNIQNKIKSELELEGSEELTTNIIYEERSLN